MKLLALFLITWIAGAAGFGIIGSGFTFFQGKPNQKKSSTSLKNSPVSATKVSATAAITTANAILNPFATVEKAASATAAAKITSPDITANTAPDDKLSVSSETGSAEATAAAVDPAAEVTALSNNQIIDNTAAANLDKIKVAPKNTTATVGGITGITGPTVALSPFTNAANVANTGANVPKATTNLKISAADSVSIPGKLNKAKTSITSPTVALSPFTNAANVANTGANVPKATTNMKISAADSVSISGKLNDAKTSITSPTVALSPFTNAANVANTGVNVPKATTNLKNSAADSVSISGKLNEAKTSITSPTVAALSPFTNAANVANAGAPTINTEETVDIKGPKVRINFLDNSSNAIVGANVSKSTGTPKTNTANSSSNTGKLKTSPTAKPDNVSSGGIMDPKGAVNLLFNAKKVTIPAGTNVPKANVAPKINVADSSLITGKIDTNPDEVVTTAGIIGPKDGLNPLAAAKVNVAEQGNVPDEFGTSKTTTTYSGSIAGKLNAMPSANLDKTGTVNVGARVDAMHPKASINLLTKNAAEEGVTEAKVPKVSLSAKIGDIESALVTEKFNVDSEVAAANDGATTVITNPDFTFNPPAIIAHSGAKTKVTSKINTNNSESISRGHEAIPAKASATAVVLSTNVDIDDIPTVSAAIAVTTPKNMAAIPKTNINNNVAAPAEKDILNYTGTVPIATTSITANPNLSVSKVNATTATKSHEPFSSSITAKHDTTLALRDPNDITSLKIRKAMDHPEDVATTVADIMLSPLNTTTTAMKATNSTQKNFIYPTSTVDKLNYEDIVPKIGSNTDIKSHLSTVTNVTKNKVNTHKVQSATTTTTANISVDYKNDKDDYSSETIEDDLNKNHENIATKYDVKAMNAALNRDSNTIVANSKKGVELNDVKADVNLLVATNMKYEDTTATVITKSTISDIMMPTVAAQVGDSKPVAVKIVDSSLKTIKNMKNSNDVKNTVASEKNSTDTNISEDDTNSTKIPVSKQDSTTVLPETLNLVNVTHEDQTNSYNLASATATAQPVVDITSATSASTDTPAVVTYNDKPLLTTIKSDFSSEKTENPIFTVTMLETTSAKYGDTSKITTPKYNVSTEDIALRIGTTTTIDESDVTTASLDTFDKYDTTSEVSASRSSNTSFDKFHSSSMSTHTRNDSEYLATAQVTTDKYAKSNLESKVNKAMDDANRVDNTFDSISSTASFDAKDISPTVRTTPQYDDNLTVTTTSVPHINNVAEFITNSVELTTKSSVHREGSTSNDSNILIIPTVTASDNFSTSISTATKNESSYSTANIRESESKNIPNSPLTDINYNTAPLMTANNNKNTSAVDIAKFVMNSQSSAAKCNITTRHGTKSNASTIKIGTKPGTGQKTNTSHTSTKVITIPVVTTAKKCTQSVVTTNKPEQLASSKGQCEPHCPCCTGCTNIVANPTEKTTVIAIIRNGGTTNIIVILNK